jgi:RNA polymerase sigma factor (sigma-70 family)
MLWSAPVQPAPTMTGSKPIVATPDLSRALHARFHGPLMAFFVRRIKDHADAEDLTQETLLRVIRAHAMERAERPESYVFTVAANLLRDHRRESLKISPASRVPIDEAVAGEFERQLVENLSPERVLLSKASLHEVLALLDQLGERTRNIFVLFRLETMKQKDIAAFYGIGQSTVEKHVMKAMLHLAAHGKDPA